MKAQEEEVKEQRFFPLDALPEDTEPKQYELIELVKDYLRKIGRLS